MNPWVLLLVIYTAVFLSGPLIAIFHELGHAIAYLIFTKPNSIDIFIGSYGIKEKALSFKTGKLNFYVKRSFPFIKGIGLCHSSDVEQNYRNFIVILLAGPVFTLLSAAIIATIAFSANAHLLVLIFCYIFLGFSVLSLLSNLIPRQISRTDGISLNSDGEQIIYTLKLKQSLPYFNEAVKHLNKKEYERATLFFKKVLQEKPGDLKILRLLVAALGMLKKYDDVALYISQIEQQGELSINDMIQKAHLLSVTHQHDEAIATYQKILKKNKNNLIALNNVAEELIDKGAFEIAQRALDKIEKLQPKFPYLYSTLAYLKIMQGKMQEGKAILDKSLAENTENAYTYKSLGIYYLKLNDVIQAKMNFNKATELDDNIDFGNYTL